MKLTRRVLAVVLAVAMLAGVLAVGVYAATANSLTSYGNYDATENPYQAKLGLKVYRVDTETEKYTEITDGKVYAGDVIRVELWGQTNYHTAFANYVMAYSNGLFAPTKLDYTTYDYAASSATGLGASVVSKVAYDEEAAQAAVDFQNENGYASYETPFAYNTTAELSTSFAGADNYSALKTVYPAAWQGTGTSASDYLNATGKGYNIVMAGYGPVAMDNFENLPATGVAYTSLAAVISYYQPLVYFNLTVPADATAGTKGEITIPEAAVKSSSNTSGRLYVSAAVPNESFEANLGDAAELIPLYQTAASAYFNHIMYKDTYEGGTKDRVVDLDDATVSLTVVTEGGEEPPVTVVNKDALETAINTLPAIAKEDAEETSWAAYEAALAKANEVFADDDATQDDVDAAEAALVKATAAVTAKPVVVAPELVALGDTIIDEARGFIYGLPHGDLGGVADLVEDGYAKVEGDGSVVCTPANGDILGTGSKVELKNAADETIKTYYIVIFGDTDGDGYITTDDVSDAKRWYAYLDSANDYEDFSNPASFAMEINGDDFVDDADFTLVKRYYAYLIDDVPQTR